MSDLPTTRHSLLLRLRDASDTDAWEEFAAVYRPVVFRFAVTRGLQRSDADDLAQNVLLAVSAQICDWNPDSDRGRFRSWLLTVAHNQTVTLFRRRKPDAAVGGTTSVSVLENQPNDLTALNHEYRRELFRRLARQVRSEFAETTWQAFWQTSVSGQQVDEVSLFLGMSRGAVYTARSRVLKRLQQLARQYENDLNPVEGEVSV